MILHLLKIIFNERRNNMWIFVELVIAFACVWYLTSSVYDKLKPILEYPGWNLENVYRVELTSLQPDGTGYDNDPKFADMGIDEQLRGLNEIFRAHPDIEYSALSYIASPYIGSNSWVIVSTDTLTNTGAQIGLVTDEYPFIYKMGSKWSSAEDIAEAIKGNMAVIDMNLAQELFNDTNCVGKTIHYGEKPIVIGAVTDAFKQREPMLAEKTKRLFVSYFDTKDEDMFSNIYMAHNIEFRVRDGVKADFLERFKDEMGTVRYGNVFALDIINMEDLRDARLRKYFEGVRKDVGYALFVICSIFLGVIGTFWFRTEQRKKEMGLRLAIGSTRTQLRTMLFAEGLLISALASVVAVLIAFNLSYFVFTSSHDITKFFICSLIAFGVLCFTTSLGIWIPSMSATKNKPAEVLHAE